VLWCDLAKELRLSAEEIEEMAKERTFSAEPIFPTA